MLIRSISAIIGIGLFAACCFAGALPFAIAVTAVTALALSELASREEEGLAARPVMGIWKHAYNLVGGANRAIAAIATLIPLAIFVAARHGYSVAAPAGIASLAMILICVGLLLRSSRSGFALGGFRSLYGLFGVGYCGLLFTGMVLLRSLPGRIAPSGMTFADRGAWIMLFVAVCVWSTDSFAYLVGRAVGRRKLAPKLSPGKTVEGALGGMTGALVAGALFGAWIGLAPHIGLAVGGIAGGAGQLGDLFESALKRELGIKDFGMIIPGHGGALDRFDSLLFVAPLAFVYLRFVGI